MSSTKKNYAKIFLLVFFVIGFIFVGSLFVKADTYSSTSFQVLDPVIGAGTERGTSSSYSSWQTLGQTALGRSTSSSFIFNPGFLTWPVSSPASNVSASAGNGQITLSWTAGTAYLGWNLGGYSIGQSTTSGGPYTYSSKGNVTSTTISGLTNGTTYYFVVINEDAFGNYIATSAQVFGTPVAPATPPSGGGGGGGGGGGPPPPAIGTQVIFTGKAYPGSTVTLLKDAQVAASTVAGPDASFQINLSGISGGNYIFSIYSEDYNGNRSSLLTFPVGVTSGATTNISGIFLAPTIAVDKSEVKKGDNIAIFGQSVSQADIIISVHSYPEIFVKTAADKNGIYLYNFDTSQIDYGQHNTKSKASINQTISEFSKTVAFTVGTKNVLASLPKKCPLKGDLNSDCKVNLVDFSIAAYWYKKPLSPAMKIMEKERLGGFGIIDLKDFSIMAYYWTG